MSSQQEFQLLVVDDDEERVRILQGWHHPSSEAAFRRANSFDQALSLARAHRPEILAVSLRLVTQSGLEAFEEWMNHIPFAPVIVLADETTMDWVPRALKLGVYDYFHASDGEGLYHRVLSYCYSRYHADEENRRLARGLYSLLMSGSDAILLLNPHTDQILDANPQALQLYGHSLATLTTMTLADLRLSLEAWRLPGGILEEPGWKTERHLREDGRVLYVETRETTLDSPDGNHRAFVIRDRTDLKEKDEELLFLRRFNSHILDMLPFGVTVRTPDGRVTYQNSYSIRVFGMLLSRTLEEAAALRPELAKLADIDLNADGTPNATELEWRERNYSFTVLRIQDLGEDGDLVVELAHDITEEKNTQKELIAAQRMEAVGNLAGGIAHDFNNLLSGILGYTNLIQAVADENPQIAQYAQVIEESCGRAAELTQQLLSFSRRKTQVVEVFDANTAARYAAKLLRHSVKKGVRLVQKLTPKKLFIKGDPAQVQQLVVNLGLAANEGMSEGQLVIITQAVDVEDDSELMARGLAPGPYAAIAVHDSGRDIDEESLKAILDPYFAGEAQHVPVGLALSVVNAISHMHGAKVLVDSEPNQGTTVTVCFPIVQTTEKTETEESAEPSEPVKGNETILVVDDEEVIRTLLMNSLSRFGYRVLMAANGEEGLNLYKMFQNEIHLIMLDVGLPGMDGTKIFRMIRAMNPSAKVIFFTGADSEKITNAFSDQEGVSCITKPISLKRLSQTLRSVLDNT